MLYMNYPRCGGFTVSASFVKECTDVSYVAGEGLGLSVHKESVVSMCNQMVTSEIRE